MAFTLWLSADEERILERIMRREGTRNKEQAVIKAIRDVGALLDAEQRVREIPASAVAATGAAAAPAAAAGASRAGLRSPSAL